MKVILSMAVSANGIIARENNSEDFFDGTWSSFLELVKKSGCVIWGRVTSELAEKRDKKYLKSLAGVQKAIITSKANYLAGEDCQVFSSPEKALKTLEKQGFTQVILSGGAKLNSSFAKLGLIDEVVFTIDSVIVGKGVPIFAPENFDLNLKLVSIRRIKCTLAQIRYLVRK